MPDNTTTVRAVFLSYAREDAEPVRRIADALRAFGLEVWFDQNELRGGDAWDQKIRTQIRTCALCIPVISATTQSRGEGYFRREWKIAVERTHDMAAGVPFLLPVVIDATPETDALVPDEFMRVQWTRLAHGVPTPQFVEQVKKQLEGKVGPVSDRPIRAEALTPAGQRPALPRARTTGRNVAATTAVVVAIVTAVLVAQKHAATGPAANPDSKLQAPNSNPPTPEPSRPVVSDKSIAVLPFENMSEDKDNAFFADGVHEDILTNLSFIHDLRVVSRTSVMQYRNTTKPISQIAQELKVAYVLEGSVRRAGNKVRVTGQLIRAATDEHVWAKAYDRDLTDVFGIQAELAQSIAGALQAALSPAEKTLLERRPTENAAAYDLYLRARQLRNNGDEDFGQMEPLLRSAVELDPKFAGAWAELASRHAYIYFNEFDHTDARLALAREAIETAQRLAPDDPAVIEGAGDYFYYGYRDYNRATEQYLRLAQLRPNDPVMYYSLALIHRREGRWADALDNFRRAIKLDPTNMNAALQFSGFLVYSHRYAEGKALARHWTETSPDEVIPAWYLCISAFWENGSTTEMDAFARKAFSPAKRESVNYVLLQNARFRGDFTEAIRLNRLQRYNDAQGDPHWLQDAIAALTLADAGETAAAQVRADEALAAMTVALERERSSSRLWASLGMMHALKGEKDEALRCAAKGKELIPESRDAVDGPQASMVYAAVLARVGEKDQALADLARLFRVPFGANVHQARHGFWTLDSFQPLHGDPRFEALLNDPANNAPLF